MKKLTAIFMASTLALGAVNLAHAADNMPPEGAPMHHKGGRDGGHEHMFKGLNLTDAQKQQIRTIMQEKHGQMKDARKDEKRALHDLVASDSFDKAKAQAQVDKMSENYKTRTLSHLETQNKIYNILTPEQKKLFNDKFEKHLKESSQRQDKMPPQ
ncbi:ATP-independent periplasmic protein-refolding chaperone Spy [Citrobacter sp. JGM124]|uniref:ATP-independent periplasmic protein-refolding chaperone Spy n=1 Tax=Citrobacter sp. JGM124 TaxID=2799789 RepID=UPI001BA64602|nr:ATP-independent periplasmic protein-refolding chaperone Spy [Citrobacter sp. JGM124]MBS0847531.1 ATP-independent periplasmic protein-refolding chaperone [Citrobacter sp. JGM124]